MGRQKGVPLPSFGLLLLPILGEAEAEAEGRQDRSADWHGHVQLPARIYFFGCQPPSRRLRRDAAAGRPLRLSAIQLSRGMGRMDDEGRRGRLKIEERVRSRWGGSEEPASLHKSMGSLAAAWRRPRSRGRAIGRTPPDCDRAADDSSLLTETMAFAGRA
ncbi:unnamed protein product [Prorocentrum cordatum]|uniref:Uncharacterized protein n=1 Tax=Prorocentrum cordatum TaxID=2364126 RepID=A0ABN9W3S5_9DINO|nr:unnamed protein product [Polarella glacialis]